MLAAGEAGRLPPTCAGIAEEEEHTGPGFGGLADDGTSCVFVSEEGDMGIPDMVQKWGEARTI